MNQKHECSLTRMGLSCPMDVTVHCASDKASATEGMTIMKVDSLLPTSLENTMSFAISVLQRAHSQVPSVLVKLDIEQAIAALQFELRGIQTTREAKAEQNGQG